MCIRGNPATWMRVPAWLFFPCNAIALPELMKIPGPDHPITVRLNPLPVRVMLGGKAIAQTTRALTLKEATYPAVQYIPREDVDMSVLVPSSHVTHCPYKGEAHYFSISAGPRIRENAAWSYETPFPAMKEIAGYLAFYPSKVDKIEGGPG